MGRHPNKAPIGYINTTAPDGRKYIIEVDSEAAIIKWSFEQLSKNAYSMEEVRRMANSKGLRCSRSNFWKVLHNPIYCGYVSLISKDSGEREFVRGIHDAVVSEQLFSEVQRVIDTKRRFTIRADELNQMFLLRGYLVCPRCNRTLSGSFSQGRTQKYPYYHCSSKCKTRYSAEVVNNNYQSELEHIRLLPGAAELFDMVLDDVNVGMIRSQLLKERSLLTKQLADQDFLISKARRLFVAEKLQFDDFSKLKKEYQIASGDLKNEFAKTTAKLDFLSRQCSRLKSSSLHIFQGFSDWDVNVKKRIIEQIRPAGIDKIGGVSLYPSSALSKLFSNDLNVEPR